MPQILEMKEIDGELWVRVGKPGDFPSGIALYTPDEYTAYGKARHKEGQEEMRERASGVVRIQSIAIEATGESKLAGIPEDARPHADLIFQACSDFASDLADTITALPLQDTNTNADN